jgi:hypothetical protein
VSAISADAVIETLRAHRAELEQGSAACFQARPIN